MSRDLSINKIAPHITSASVPGVYPAQEVPSFSPYISRSHEQHSGGQEDRDEAGRQQPGPAFPADTAGDDIKPEIFKLIAIPDFSGFLALAKGKESADLMYIIKSIRSKRGVTESMPISSTHIPDSKDFRMYLNTSAHFAAPKGEQFTGKM